MKSFIKEILIAISAMAMLGGCQKEIDFEYREIDPITVIEGNLTTEYASVVITETTPVDEPMNTTHLTDASVILEDITAGSASTLQPDGEGVYRADGLVGVPGHKYRLNVERGGLLHTCESEMLAPVQILEFGFQRVSTPMGHLIVAQVAFLDNPETRGDCYIVRFFRNGELYNWGTISDIQAYDNILLASIKVIDAADLPDDAHQDDGLRDNLLQDGDELTAIIVPVTRTYFNYLVALNQGSNGPRLFTTTSLAALRSSLATTSLAAPRSSLATTSLTAPRSSLAGESLPTLHSSAKSSSHSGEGFCLGYFLAAPESSVTAIFRPAEL